MRAAQAAFLSMSMTNEQRALIDACVSWVILHGERAKSATSEALGIDANTLTSRETRRASISPYTNLR